MDKPIQYTISFSHFTNNDNELVGVEALELHQLAKSNIPLPQGFVITSKAFDDYLVANDLVQAIGDLMGSFDVNNKSQIRTASKEITNLILAGKFPQIISSPIIKSYKNLSGLRHTTTLLRASVPDESIQELEYQHSTTRLVATDEEDFLSKIKIIWAGLFSEQALIHREKIDYEGYVTSSVIVQKLIQAEVSGKVFTQDSNDGLMEVQAIFGVDDLDHGREIVPDSYYVEKKSEELVEKKIIGQEWMLVRKPKPTEKSAFMKVNISKAWKKRQKLDDRHIINVARLAKAIEKTRKSPQIISFIVEAGKIFVYDIEPLKQHSLIKHTELQQLAEKLEERHPLEIKKHEELPEPEPKTIDQYVEEIKNINTPKPPAVEAKKVNDEEAQVVVSIEPLDKLEKLVSGISKGDKLAFGLAHFIYTDSDWIDLTGDEILIVDKLDLKFLGVINNSKGIVIRHQYNANDLGKINVPVIHGADGVFERLHENEVVTMDTESAGVYLGAGKKVAKNNNQTESLSEIIPTTKDEEVQQENVAKPEEVNAIQEFFFENFEIISNKTDQKISLSSQFFQLVNVAKPKADIENTNGLVINMNDYYIAAGLTPERVISEGRLKRKFIESIVKQLKPVLESMKGNPAILRTSSLTNQELSKLNGYDMSKKRDSHISAISHMLDIPQLFDFELEILSIIRNRESQRNLWLCVSDVRTADDLIRAKKAITSYGFRRSSTFKLYAELVKGYAAIAIKEISDGSIDGIILNLDKIMHDLKKHRANKLDDVTANFLAWAAWVINSSNTAPYLLTEDVYISDDQLHQFIDKGVSHYMASYADVPKLMTIVAGQEVKKLEKKKKRGRKKKNIDYGY